MASGSGCTMIHFHTCDGTLMHMKSKKVDRVHTQHHGTGAGQKTVNKGEGEAEICKHPTVTLQGHRQANMFELLEQISDNLSFYHASLLFDHL